MKGIISLSICLLLLAPSINADGVYQNTVDFGTVGKGPIATKSFNIPTPPTPYNIQAVQVILLNKTSNQPFDHDSIVVSSIDFIVASKKIISFTTSNILTSLTFPSPNVIAVDGAMSLSASMITTNVEAQDLVIEYIFKYSTDSSNIVKLTRTAASVVANFSSFEVPKGTGGFSISNSIVWQQNSLAMGFLAAVSPGIVSITFSESGGSVVCQSAPTYSGKYLESMSLCPGTFNLVKGSTYTSTAVYDNSILRKGVFANWGFYVGFPRATTTGGSSSTGPASTHTSTGPATTHTSSGPATTHTSSGPSSSGPSSSGPHSSGPSSSGPSSSGPSSSTTSQTSGSQTDSSQTSATGSSQTGQFTTTNGQTGGTSGSHQSGDSTGSAPTGSTGYTVSSGSSGFLNWNPSASRKIEIY